MSQFSGIAPQIVVSDVVATATYYRDVLGFTLFGYFLDPPVYAMVGRDGIQIHFGKADGEAVQQTNVPLRKVGFDLYIWVSDIDALYAELLERGADLVEKPVDRVYGNRECAVRDCNGFKITFGQL